MRYPRLCLVLGLCMAVMSWAQQAEKSPPSPAPPAPGSEAVGVHDPNFHYIAGRDPFEQSMKGPGPNGKCRPVRSVADLLVEEVVITGIFQRGGKYHALVRGSGLKGSTTITAGQKLCNGELMEVGPYTDENTGERKLCAVFRVQTDDPIRPFIRQVKCLAAS